MIGVLTANHDSIKAFAGIMSQDDAEEGKRWLDMKIEDYVIAPGYYYGSQLLASLVNEKIFELADRYRNSDSDFLFYGVCDTPEQFIERYRYAIEKDSRILVILFHEVTKEEDPFWRWHKWGTYIGRQHPMCEHIGDEPVIEKVYSFSVYEIVNGAD